MQLLRKTTLLLAMTMAFLAVGWLAFDFKSHPRLLTGPMLQKLAPNEFTLLWQMHPQEPAVVDVCDTRGNRVGEFPATLDNDRYIANLNGLRPGTTYQYEIRATTSGELWPPAASATLTTNPKRGGSFRFIAFGDSGDGRSFQRRLARQMPQYRPDLLIHTGDLIYDRGETKDYPTKFYLPYRQILGSAAFYPVLGNHDNRTADGQPLFDQFILPENGPTAEPPERHYWFDFGHARFVAFDSNLDEPQLQETVAPWLNKVLASAGDRWKIVFFHEPPYTNGRYEPAAKIRSTIVPILDQHNVELVLCGHDHMYQRTHPIRAGTPTPDGQGTVYVITAAGGARLYPFRSPPPDYIAAWNNDQHSFTLADVTPTMILLRQIDITSRRIDTTCITRQTSSTPTTQTAITGP